ncbi:MAG TPA: hypothetical protein VFY18_14680, partial [Candidatus Limnocylindrales bacterium]|nr:hypothetical protein [Candidatus Limnocylindrales bacterium]
MTRRHAALRVRHPRDLPPVGAARPILLAVTVAAAVAVAGLLGGCGHPLSSGPPGAASSPGTPGSAAPGTTPQPTAWPGNAVIGIVGLGAGDTEIAKAVADFSEAVAAEDLVRMRGAAGGLQNLVNGLSKEVDRISIYPPMAGLVDQYRTAFAPMLDGARKLQDAIDAGDAKGIVSATERITEGMQA